MKLFNKWIPVNDELPKSKDDYTKDNINNEYYFVKLKNGVRISNYWYGWTNPLIQFGSDVTHWKNVKMPKK